MADMQKKPNQTDAPGTMGSRHDQSRDYDTSPPQKRDDQGRPIGQKPGDRGDDVDSGSPSSDARKASGDREPQNTEYPRGTDDRARSGGPQARDSQWPNGGC